MQARLDQVRLDQARLDTAAIKTATTTQPPDTTATTSPIEPLAPTSTPWHHFDTIVRDQYMLSLFLEFCGSHADATVSTNCLTLWLEIENHRQLIGDHRSLQRNGHRLWNWYLKKTIAGNVRHLVPHQEVRRLCSLCSSSTATGITLDTFSKVQALLQCVEWRATDGLLCLPNVSWRPWAVLHIQI